MRRLLLVACMAMATSLAWSQGGSWYVGGIAGFNQQSDDGTLNPSITNWYFGPEVGTFFNEKWSAGIVVGLNGSNSKNDDGDISKSSTFMPNIYGRRWWSVGEKLSLFAGLDVNFGSGSTTTYEPEEMKVETTSFGTNLNGGVAYALAQRWTLLMKFSALGYTSEKTGDITTSNFGLIADGNITSNQFIFVGLYWTFIPPKE